MAKTLEETLAGADFEGGESFCDDLYNSLKNHWRANYGGDPCTSSGALESPQPGMIISDEYDDRLYHVLLTSDCACSEIVQDCVPLSDDKEIVFGNDWDGQIGYDELTNDALILGIPMTDKRGLIICDEADVVPDITAAPYNLGTTTEPTIYMLDADLDSYLGIGHQVDDRPGIWSGPDDSKILAIQYEANADVTFFENTPLNVNRWVYIYGGDTATREWLRMRVEADGDALIEAENDLNVTAATVHLTGGQIAFPAVPVPSADLKTLDDYEEGEWTFDLQFGGAKQGLIYSAEYTKGYYTKIGNIVTVSGLLILTSKGTSNGDAILGGLPFVGANSNYAVAAPGLYFSVIAYANQFQGRLEKNTATVILEELTSALNTATALTDADFHNASRIAINLTYRVA